MADTRGRGIPANQWQDWGNLILAIWLFISPWVLGFANGGFTAAAGNAWIFGVVIAVLSIAALARAEPWEEWINLLAGVWLVVSPWVLGYSGNSTAMRNAVVVGVLVFILAVWDLIAMQQTAGRRA